MGGKRPRYRTGLNSRYNIDKLGFPDKEELRVRVAVVSEWKVTKSYVKRKGGFVTKQA